MNGFPVWSPTGEKIAYVRSFGTGMNMDIVTQSSNGGGTPAVVLPAPGLRALQDWSIRGDLLYVDLTSGKGDLFTLPLTSASPTPSPYLQTPFNESQARFPPDGNWVAYESDETGKPQVYVRPFPIPPGGGPKRTISINGGTQPRWSRDGKTLYYLGSNPDSVMAVNVRSPPIFSYHAPKRLFDAPRQEPPGDTSPMATWDVAPSGLGFVLTTDAAPDVTQQTPLSVVMNWFELVK